MYACGAFLAGLVFGVGLLVSGMVNPAKVLGFLDLAGPWDPSLALVMAGAVAVGAVAFAFAGRRAATLLVPGGVIAVSTGDAASLAARAFGSHWHLLTPRHHNFFFTRADGTTAAERCAIDAVERLKRGASQTSRRPRAFSLTIRRTSSAEKPLASMPSA